MVHIERVGNLISFKSFLNTYIWKWAVASGYKALPITVIDLEVGHYENYSVAGTILKYSCS